MLVVQLVGEAHVTVGSSALKKNDVFFTKSNSKLYLMRGLRSDSKLDVVQAVPVGLGRQTIPELQPILLHRLGSRRVLPYDYGRKA